MKAFVKNIATTTVQITFKDIIVQDISVIVIINANQVFAI
jgi:hypothetical protein